MNVKITDNSDEVERALSAATEKALEIIGLKAEGYAKRLCPVDTGLLRNSITHAVSGQSTSISEYKASYGSNRHTSGKNAGKRYSARSKNAGTVGSGSYSGSIGQTGEKAVYIGSNVEYAPYVEMGTQRTKAQPYLKPAAEDHLDEYKAIVESTLKNA